jgi:outer membrane receptor protein involved in Fe transport
VRGADFDLKTTNVLLAGMGPAGQSPGSMTGPFSVDESKVTTKYQLTWRPSETLMLYGLAAQGFRPGGFNDAAFDPLLNPNGAIPESYESDSLWSYELGEKTYLLNRRATLNTALYFIDWSDIQVTAYDQVTGAVSFTTNASKAEVYGVESEFSIALTRQLQLTLSGAYTHAELTENQPAPPAGAPARAGLPGRTGDRLPNVPRFSGSALASYEFPIRQSDWTGFVSSIVSYTGSSGTYLRRDDPFYREQDAYTLANFRFGVYDDLWRLTAFIDNVTDERAELFINNQSGWDKINVNRPRTWGITVRRSF